MDLRIPNGSVIQVVGPSGSGKTLFVCNLLQHRIFTHDIRRIQWHMGVDEGEDGKTDTELSKLKNVSIVKGFPDGWLEEIRPHDVIVIDDLYQEANKEKDFNNLFTKIARHRNVTVIFITQNLFHQGGSHRTRNMNVHYLVIFKNPRDQTVINYIARQAFPKNPKFLIDAFQDATFNKPHGYLFIDFSQTCPDEIRVRTDIFNKNGITVYKQSDEFQSSMQ